ncbi:MAG TPA: TRAP transporter fused permease subunit, partial [Afifellaceae bacterium]|nr:TRAP transporter fused permease subunit [Afifellaceae bacterium]
MEALASLILPSPHAGQRERALVSAAVAILAVAVTALVVYGAYFGTITALVLRALFFSGMAAAGLLAAGLQLRPAWLRALVYLLALAALMPGPYLHQVYFDMIMRGGLSALPDRLLFLTTTIIVLVLVRLTLGWSLIVLVLAALAYAVFGDLIPGRYGHGGYDLARLASTLFLSTEGYFGLPMGVAVQYIFLFALLGTLLMKIGTGEVFVDIARAVTGRMQGGPGLSATLSSALIGTINGSAVANVVTTGTFTIPLMKRVGYTPVLAGGIEAAASSAGQILPPIMGAAAFLMAEIIGVPYSHIALAAAIPGALYVIALLVAVRLEAGKLGLARDETGGLAALGAALLTRGYLLLPLVALIGFLIAGYTPTRAAVYCLAMGLIIMPWRRETRLGPVGLVAVCLDTVKATVPIVAAVAAAGAVIGVLNLTGMGLMMSGMILDAGGGKLWLVLLLTAFASFVLGMG